LSNVASRLLSKTNTTYHVCSVKLIYYSREIRRTYNALMHTNVNKRPTLCRMIHSGINSIADKISIKRNPKIHLHDRMVWLVADDPRRLGL